MVTDAILRALTALGTWVLGLMGTITLPDWVATVTAWIGTTVQGMLALGNWIPWPAVGLAFVFIYGAWGIAFGVRVVRIVASFLTAGGGSAA